MSQESKYDYILSIDIDRILKELGIDKKIFYQKNVYTEEKTSITIEFNSSVDTFAVINKVVNLLKNKQYVNISCDCENNNLIITIIYK